MKKLLILILLLFALLMGGLWLLLRRGPISVPPTETSESFQVQPSEAGLLMQYSDGQTPLRAIRWLPPLPNGLVAVQILTQSNRQQVVLFSPQGQTASLLVPKPAGVREGFFNFAELHDAAIVPGDVAVFLYRASDPTSGELPLVIAVDLTSQTLRWVHRAVGDRLVMTGTGKDSAVYLFGSESPILRIPLALHKGEGLGSSPFRAGLKPMEMPPEIRGPVDLVPTGSWSFLLCHLGGLSSFAEGKGWQHWAPPTDASLAFPAARPALAHGKHYWWQPFPGRLIKVKADGTTLNSFDAIALAPPEPWSRDGSLLVLRGADASGCLWFTLAAPLLPSPLATPAPSTSEKPESSETQAADESHEGSPSPKEDWATYSAEGLDRIYCWNPDRRAFLMRPLPELWASLPPLPGLSRPSSLKDLRPESGCLLLDSGASALRLPLDKVFQGTKPSEGKPQVR